MISFQNEGDTVGRPFVIETQDRTSTVCRHTAMNTWGCGDAYEVTGTWVPAMANDEDAEDPSCCCTLLLTPEVVEGGDELLAPMDDAMDDDELTAGKEVPFAAFIAEVVTEVDGSSVKKRLRTMERRPAGFLDSLVAVGCMEAELEDMSAVGSTDAPARPPVAAFRVGVGVADTEILPVAADEATRPNVGDRISALCE